MARLEPLLRKIYGKPRVGDRRALCWIVFINRPGGHCHPLTLKLYELKALSAATNTTFYTTR